jgi:pimeloyl-ACP methyl ester carboxylesterase
VGAPLVRELPASAGVSLHAMVWEAGGGGGDGDRPLPVLLIHGLASNCRTWERTAARLNELGHPVVALDLRGHGQSDKIDYGFDFMTLSADLLWAMAELHYDRLVVVGQSTGGNLALEVAIRFPDKVAGVVGVDGGIIELQEKWPSWPECAAALAPPPLEGRPPEEVEAEIRKAHPTWSDWGVEATMANLAVSKFLGVKPLLTRESHMRLLESLWRQRPSTMLASLRVPLLLLLADAGDGTPAVTEAQAARAQAAGATVRWFSPADHDLHVERPAEVADEVHAFAATL